MTMTFPPALLALEARAWADIQAGRLTPDMAEAVHAAIADYAEQAGVERIDVEVAVKQTVRHGDG